MKPKFPMIAEMKNHYFVNGDEHSLIKNFFHGKSVIFDKELHSDKPIQEYFDKDFKDSIEEQATNFINEIKKHEKSDIIFSLLPYNIIPHLSVFTQDPVTGFSARLMHGTDLLFNKPIFIFEFHAVFFPKYRKIETPTIEGERWEIKQ